MRHPNKNRGVPYGLDKKSRNTRRDEAEARQEAYKARTTQQQLELVRQRPGASQREVAKLESLLAKTKTDE